MKYKLFGLLLCNLMSKPVLADAEFSLFERNRGTLISSLHVTSVEPADDQSYNSNGSLFPSSSRGMFLTRKANLNSEEEPETPAKEGDTTTLKRLYSLIERAESRKDNYNAIHHKAKSRPHKPPTQLTLREIFTWIEHTPGQPHAIGRYQFIPKTLKTLVKQEKLPLDSQFSPLIQDQLARVLVDDAGYEGFISGHLHPHQFMHNLSKIWAGLPTKSGRSFYHGYAGNKSSISWSEFEHSINTLKSG